MMNPIRLIGKLLVAVGLTAAIALAIAAPVAFSMQIASPLRLLEVAGVGIVISLIVVKLGDLLADRAPPVTASESAGLPSGRQARSRSIRSATPLAQPLPSTRSQRL